MARTRKFNDLIDRLPETGKTLLDWHKWLTRNHYRMNPNIDVRHTTNELKIEYKYEEENYEGIKLIY